MTAEITVMNRQAVALAADSAVTLSGAGKIYASANKIFGLSKYRPVGIMVYGNASLLGLPWETIIKRYRNELRERSFRTLREYSDDFLEYLRRNHAFFPAEVQRDYVTQIVHAIFEEVRDEALDEVTAHIHSSGGITDDELRDKIDASVRAYSSLWRGAEDLPLVVDPSHSENAADSYGAVVVRAIDAVFEKLPVSDASREALFGLGVAQVTKTLHRLPTE